MGEFRFEKGNFEKNNPFFNLKKLKFFKKINKQIICSSLHHGEKKNESDKKKKKNRKHE